ncbi:MAG: tRNA (adenosine(37)-N6)-threonylcarbamoyltransferase complex dimerization subunit type 1 TsaB [Spirochaetes bacterium]|nr:tRNA (adenosine(37)-N6)-threonylcarbamoyltransferase complex dimerization subunit type 1 TsaB [Spirochaetota bacterium]
METMNYLAFDTSSKILKLIVKINAKTIALENEDNSKHIENLLPAIDKSLKKIKCDKSDINIVGVCTGPGSFTGIRIGISAALGISFASKIKCFGFSVFEVYKYLLKDQKNSVIIPIIDAKKEKYYCSFIEPDDDIEYYDISLDQIIENIKLKYNSKQIIFTGEDFKIIKDKIKNKINFIEKFNKGYSSKDMADYIENLLKKEKKLDHPHPIYIRKSDAEIEYLKNQQLKKP